MAVTTESASARARAAARTLATLGRGAKDDALEQIALALERETAAIVEANAEDLAAARAAGQSSALLDRLTLDAGRVLDLCAAVRAIAALEDPVGDVVSGWRLPNGLDIQKVRVPLGVLLVVYEARPNVTVDVAGLCLKSGNACILRGSTSARHTNAVLLRCVREGLTAAGLPEDAVIPLEATREELAAIISDPSACDVVIPRGGEGLKKFLLEHARVPVLVAAGGNCHVYLHADADPAKALPIVVNAKTHRPGVCNAAETLLVHRDALPLLGPIGAELAALGVELRADEEAAGGAGRAQRAGRRGGLGDRVPRPGARRAHRWLGRGGHRPHRAVLDRPLRGDRDRRAWGRRTPSSAASRAPACTSMPRRASRTAGSSASAPRSATRQRACTPVARSASPTSRRRSTSCTATGRSAPELQSAR